MSELVSVVIPTYNYGHYLGRAIDSVLTQTWDALQCIVVDNGSTDDTSAVLASYADRIEVINQANSGPSAARNAGIATSRGEYIAFLDADDWWEPEKIRTQIDFLRTHPEVSAVGCAENQVNEKGSLQRVVVPEQLSSDLKENLCAVALRRKWIGGTTSGVVVRHKVFENIGGFDELLIGAEDWDMWLRLVAVCYVQNLPDILLNRRIHSSGFARNVERWEMAAWRVYDKAVLAWPDVLDTHLRRQIRALILDDAADELVAAGNLKLATRRYLAAMQATPLTRRRWLTLFRIQCKRAHQALAAAGQAR